MAISNGLITLEEAKQSLGMSPSTTTYDTDLEAYIEAATPVIENITGPILAGSRTFVIDGTDGAVVLPVPFTSVTSITEGSDVLSSTKYTANGSAGIIHAGSANVSHAWAEGTQNITVTVAVGASEVPPNVKLAARELVRFWWQQGRQGNRPGFGNEFVADNDVPSGFAVPRRVIELLQPNARMAGFA